MKKALLDTSFILTAVRNKIDFCNEINFMGIKILVPKQILSELEKINLQEARLAMQILKKHKFEKIDLKTKNTDNGIILYAKYNPEVLIATLDREIKRKIKNPKIIIRGKKKLEVI